MTMNMTMIMTMIMTKTKMTRTIKTVDERIVDGRLEAKGVDANWRI